MPILSLSGHITHPQKMSPAELPGGFVWLVLFFLVSAMGFTRPESTFSVASKTRGPKHGPFGILKKALRGDFFQQKIDTQKSGRIGGFR